MTTSPVPTILSFTITFSGNPAELSVPSSAFVSFLVHFEVFNLDFGWTAARPRCAVEVDTGQELVDAFTASLAGSEIPVQ